MILLRNLRLILCKNDLGKLPEGKLLINTVNAFSYVTATQDPLFQQALIHGDVLIPDGISIVMACRWFKEALSHPTERVAGWDLFEFDMHRVNDNYVSGPKPKVLFMGSSQYVLDLIAKRASVDFPNLEIVSYSPPFIAEFPESDSQEMVDFINQTNPDLLWIGMTAPKQEKWIYSHWSQLDIHCHVGTIGAVFDFYAGTVKRAPIGWQKSGFEWLYRLISEPKRMWRRYLIGNTQFILRMLKEKMEK